MFKLLKDILFGAPLFIGCVIFLLVTLVFTWAGLPVPSGWRFLFVGILLMGSSSILPDTDMILYQQIYKRNDGMVFALALASALPLFGIGWWFNWYAFRILALFAFTAFVVPWALAAQKVRARASHWPVWHHPILVIPAWAFIVALFAREFDSENLWFYEAIAVLPLLFHFAHDSIQRQGFSWLSPFSDTHFSIGWPHIVSRVSDDIVTAHYALQALNAKERTSKEELEWRARGTITAFTTVRLLLGALCVSIAILVAF